MPRAFALLPAVAFASAPAVAAPETHAARTAQRILSDLQTVSGVPGLGAAVWRGDRIAWTGRAGYRDLARKLPVTDATRFRFASVSKVFAATAAAKLREEGKLDVDAPVVSMLSYLKNDWPPITARQLSAHVAGIPHYQAIDQNRGGQHFATMADAVGVFSGRALLSPPGTRYEYSSYGYTLLSAVVEAKADRPYLDYLAAAITPGLAIGMDATGTTDPNASRAYVMEGGAPVEAKPHDYSYSLGGAGLGGTAPALATWGGRLVEGRVVAPATLAWMAEPARLNDGTAVAEADYGLGFGWRIARDLDGVRLMHHAGVTDGARSVVILAPDQKVAISLLANALWTASIERSALTIAAALRPAPALAARSCPVQATRFTGRFGDAAIAGDAHFAVEGGLCVATLSTANALGAWLDGITKRRTVRLQLVGIDAGNGLTRAALVTPIGAYELRPTPTGYAAQFGPTRSVTLDFS